ncbi:ATP-binding protein [bacterium]|nr:ATP-binding protein [bacterium]
MDQKRGRYHLNTPSSSENLGQIRDFVGEIARKAGFTEEYVNKIQIAVDEACTNVVQHAYKGMIPKDIDVLVEVNSDKLTVTVSDQGRGFDPHSFPPLDMNAYFANLKRGGLGIYLIHMLMDEVEFMINPGRKNSVRMVKFLHPVESSERKQNQKILLEKSRERKRHAVSE